uniref:Putative ORF4 protein n=1 Tax=Ceratitis capitata TaxID=7213 RepID=W8AX67_CERCA
MGGPQEMTIRAYDRPMRILAGLSTLSKTPAESDDIDLGLVVSEVGNPTTLTHPAWPDPFIGYHLRAPRENCVPDFIFGSMELGDAFSAFLPRKFPAPAVGTPLVIDPIITPAQKVFFDLYKNISADVIMIIHVPAPLGVGIYLEVYAPEFDITTVTRGIRFKPSGQPTVAVKLPWSNDLSLVNSPRPGQSGGSIVIKTVEDNSSETVNTPIAITVWCCVTNVNLTGWALNATTGIDYPKINFQRLTAEDDEISLDEYIDDSQSETNSSTGSFIQEDNSLTINPKTGEIYPVAFEHGEEDDNEVSAEGGKSVEDLEYSKVGVPVAPLVETQAEKVELPLPGMAVEKKDTGHVATKWYAFATIEISDTVTSWQRVVINPYTNANLQQLGESLSLAWKRNVWTTGAMDIGYMRSLVVQINIPRPPQISGVLEVKDSANSSSIHLIEFGGKVEIPLIPQNWNGLATSLPRYWLNPWLRTDESEVAFYYRVAAFNRTSEIANLNIRVLVRPGYANFEVPLKPRPRAAGTLTELAQLMRQAVVAYEHGSLPEQSSSYVASPHKFITPQQAHSAEQFNLHHQLGDDENIELDEFPVLVYKGELKVGEVTPIPLNLAEIVDLDWESGENAISQKFERFAHIIPKSAGGFGPVVGNYTIGLRLPTTIAGQIVHNCLPGDMVDETVARIFGLSSLLGIAGTAISSVGGPLVNGIINTTAPILSGAAHAIGGDVIGGVADAALGVASSIFGKSKKPNVSEEPNAIAGDIPISRFVEMIKYVGSNYSENPVFPTLLVEPRNFFDQIGNALKSIPVEIFANMRNAKVERSLFDRSVLPEPTIEQDIIIPREAIPRILERFDTHRETWVDGSKQNVWLKKFMLELRERKVGSLSLLKIKGHSIPSGLSLLHLIEKSKSLYLV